MDTCAFGARDPVSHKLNLKPTSLLRNLPPNALMPIFKRCANRYLSKKHEHEPLEGNAKGHGSRTHLAQIYHWLFCKILPSCIAQMLWVRPNDQCTTLFLDLFDEFSDKECLAVLRSFHQSVDENLLSLINIVPVKMKHLVNSPEVMSLNYQDLPRLTKAINALGGNVVEQDLHYLDKTKSEVQELSKCCSTLRKKIVPSYIFEKCFVYRNNSGLDNAFALVFVWSSAHDHQLFVLPARACDFTDFDPRTWYFVVFAEGKDPKTGKPPELTDAPIYKITTISHLTLRPHLNLRQIRGWQPSIPMILCFQRLHILLRPPVLVGSGTPVSGLGGDSRAGPPNFSPIDDEEEDNAEQIDVDDIDIGPPNDDLLRRPASPRPSPPPRPAGSPTPSNLKPSKKAKSQSRARVKVEESKG